MKVISGNIKETIEKDLAKVAAIFGVRVSEKIAAQAIPVAGDAGGAVINL